MSPRDKHVRLTCSDCGARLGIATPKVQYGDSWRCSDCSYRLERSRESDPQSERHGARA